MNYQPAHRYKQYFVSVLNDLSGAIYMQNIVIYNVVTEYLSWFSVTYKFLEFLI